MDHAKRVTATAPGKVNLSLHVGPVGADGYHPLRTVFQALSLTETVTVSSQGSFTLEVAGLDASQVPLDESNSAVVAGRALREVALARGSGPLPAGAAISLRKGVPVAGGMAGGSADAAAALVALNELWNAGLSHEELLEIAARVGADVPFTLLGGTAQGVNRGDRLVPVPVSGTFHWALGMRNQGLSTARVFSVFDADGRPSSCAPELDFALLEALKHGDVAGVGAALHNDLQPISCQLMPELKVTIAAALEAGALGAIVSGSGPTIAALGSSAEHVQVIAEAMAAAGATDRTMIASGPAPGTRVV